MGKCYYCIGSDYIGDHGRFILARQNQKCHCTYPEEYKNSDHKHRWGNEFTNSYGVMACNCDCDNPTTGDSSTLSNCYSAIPYQGTLCRENHSCGYFRPACLCL